MKSTVWDWVTNTMLDRIGTLLVGWFATRAEARLLRSQMAELRDLEELADRYEDEGKAQLAERLRQRAARLGGEAPSGTALDLIEGLSGDAEVIRKALAAPESSGPRPEPKPLTDETAGRASPARNGSRRRTSRRAAEEDASS